MQNSQSIRQPRSVLLVANGECDAATLKRCLAHGSNQPQHPMAVVCVDGGLRHCHAASVVPDVLLGDLDSANADHVKALDAQRTRFITFPSDKDASDLQLALEFVGSEYMQAEPSVEVLLAGLSGGRTDHMLANWLLLGSEQWQFPITVFDALGMAYVVTAAHPRRIQLPDEVTFSLLALRDTKGLSVSGARYPLDDARLQPQSSLGISNVTQSAPLEVTLGEGAVVMYVNSTEVSGLD